MKMELVYYLPKLTTDATEKTSTTAANTRSYFRFNFG